MLERLDLNREAVKVNGLYIEDAIDGYYSFSSTGREVITRNYSPAIIGITDGEFMDYSRYEARIIRITFVLIGKDESDLFEKLNHLNNLMSEKEESDFIFNNESDKFYSGYSSMTDNVVRKNNIIKGEWQIYCAYPFKRSVNVIALTSNDSSGVEISGNSAVFTFDYNGTHEGKPILQAEFVGAHNASGDLSADGDCGFVAFMDSDENIIQLGNPNAVDLDEYASALSLINREFDTINDWLTTGQAYGNKKISGNFNITDINDEHWNKDAGYTASYVNPIYGSNDSWHGPILRKHTAGAVDFEASIVHRLCCSNINELGSFEFSVRDSSGANIVAGFIIEKGANGTSGEVKYIINGSVVGTDAIDLSYYNTNFGYCNKTPVYTTQYYKKKGKTGTWQNKYIKGAKTRKVISGYTYTQSNLNSKIVKTGNKITFNVGNLTQKIFNNEDVKNTTSTDIVIHMCSNGSNPPLHTNNVNYIKFNRNPLDKLFEEIQNVFTAGDIVEADCNDASVYIMKAGTIEGQSKPQYGALGNNWENFKLNKGTNVIAVTWSDWINPNYKPIIRIMFNEVFV